MEKEEENNIFDLMLYLAQEVAALKETECVNSGKNWYDKFYNTVKELEDKVNPNQRNSLIKCKVNNI